MIPSMPGYHPEGDSTDKERLIRNVPRYCDESIVSIAIRFVSLSLARGDPVELCADNYVDHCRQVSILLYDVDVLHS